MGAKRLPDQPFNAISLHRQGYEPLGDNKPQPGTTIWRYSTPIGRPLSGFVDRLQNALGTSLVGTGKHPVEFRLVREAVIGRKAAGGLTQTESRLRPLARRALSTWRPPLVAILDRKPWVRLRLIVLG